ncbi:uncharacterized protein LOC132669551 isoform X2 [Panthera onca]|uniref:uncharacterized protein LOC132669551 isoform X3 n=1 Tax=Panthera onca TaxID=9690 RepID=UPI002953F181|nr:uncharacterized protein LOC132669551 isoform X3 [Panthera onca]XP_060475499.1 uncharacterized protein LOC132669551 isoform X3 [Panthera onca]
MQPPKRSDARVVPTREPEPPQTDQMPGWLPRDPCTPRAHPFSAFLQEEKQPEQSEREDLWWPRSGTSKMNAFYLQQQTPELLGSTSKYTCPEQHPGNL